MDALSDLPHSGSPPKADQVMIQSIVRKEEKGFKTLPVFVKQEIQEQTGVSYHLSYVRKLMHRYGLSSKRPRIHHTKKAKKSNIVQWQYRLKEHISRLKEKKFTILVQDESIFVHDPKSGRKYWTTVGHPPTSPYHTKHKKTIGVWCSIMRKKRSAFFHSIQSLTDQTLFHI